MKTFERRSFVKICALGALSIPLASCLQACSSIESSESSSTSSGSELNTLTAFYYDTYIEISAYTSDQVLAELDSLLEGYEGKFSRTLEGSDVYRINAAQGEPVEVSSETADLISRSLEYCAMTDGVFNIGIGAISELWDFVEGVIPDPDVLAEACNHVDYTNIEVVDNVVCLHDPDMRLELGSVAKGYIADKTVEFLTENGCESALISLGGNMYGLGCKPDGSAWSIGVQDPTEATGTVMAAVQVIDGSVVTSGTYERSFEQDGILYHHILEPSTGMPAQTGILGVTVTGEDSFKCDVYTTLCFLLGVDDGMEALETEGSLEGLFYTDDDEVLVSSGLEATFVEGIV